MSLNRDCERFRIDASAMRQCTTWVLNGATFIAIWCAASGCDSRANKPDVPTERLAFEHPQTVVSFPPFRSLDTQPAIDREMEIARGVECVIEVEAQWADVDRNHPPLRASFIQILPKGERRLGSTVLRASQETGRWVYRGAPIYPPDSGTYSFRITMAQDVRGDVLAALALKVVAKD
jgi:hypothetical protein